MKILPFPDRSEQGRRAEEAWLADLDDALSGEREDAAAAQWRELAEDVRSLPPAMSEDFELRLERQVEEWKGERATQTRSSRLLPSFSRRSEMGALLSAAVAVIVALLLVAPWRSGSQSGSGSRSSSGGAATFNEPSNVAGASSSASAGAAEEGPAGGGASAGGASAGGASAGAEAASPLAASQGATATNGPLQAAPSGTTHAGATSAQSLPQAAPTLRPAGGRVQQVAASITLSPTRSEVQRTSGRVSQVTTGDGGFVQSSHVEVNRHGSSEARLTLRIPSAKLDQALASLEALAPVKAKSQFLQDITDSYHAAKRRLADARSQREALLRALAKAFTEAEIDSLHRRLSQASREVARATDALAAVTRRGQVATVQVTIVSSSSSSGAGGVTIERGLHDAGQALTIALVVLLLALSILLPIALVLAALALAHRAWRRRSRERSLDAA